MKSTRPVRSFLSALTLAALPGTFASEKSSPAFHDLSFEAACQRAAAEQKLVLIDFWAAWCSPCKLLDTTTWRDPQVIALLQSKTVALKIDAEKQVDLARRFKIDAYPTLLLLKADGTELDRFVGYREADKFIEEFTADLAGKTATQQAQDAVTNATNEQDRVQARFQLGDFYAQKGRHAEALAEYLWCFDTGMVQVKSFSGVRVSFLLSRIAQLAKQYPPAQTALEERRDRARAAHLAGDAKLEIIQDLAALNRTLEDAAGNLALYHQLPPGDERRRIVGFALREKFLEEQRYQDALEAEPYARIESLLGWLTQAAVRPNQPEEVARMQHQSALGYFAEKLEILAGAGDLEHARAVLARALEFDRTETAQVSYRTHLERAGHPELLAASK